MSAKKTVFFNDDHGEGIRMESKELLSSLSEEVKQKLAECKTQEEIRKVLAQAGVEPLDDGLLDAVAGGTQRGPLPGVKCRKKA